MHEASGFVGTDDIWFEVRKPLQDARAVLFLDRDGVLIEDCGYISDPADVELVQGIVSVMTCAEARAVPVVIVTNQSAIGRGYSGWAEFENVQERMMSLLAAAGLAPSAVLACPHHPDGQPPYDLADPPMRKPNPGMILRVLGSYGISAPTSLMIGDKRDDMVAAVRSGLGGGIWIAPRGQTWLWDGGRKQETTISLVETLEDAAPLVDRWFETGRF